MECLFLVTGGVCPRQDHRAGLPVEDHRFYFALIEAKAANADQNDHDDGCSEIC